MAQSSLFISFLTPRGRAEPDALLGFTLPALPSLNMTGPDASLRLVNALWQNSNIALDLRFVAAAAASQNAAVYLLCRLRRPPHVQPGRFREHCVMVAGDIQRSYKDYGYELIPISDHTAFVLAFTPFQRPALAEIRRSEELHLLEDAFKEFETYVTYPWEWAIKNYMPLFETLTQQRGPCAASIYLEPTNLNVEERTLLGHATSGQVREFLLRGGAQEHDIYDVYQTLQQRLRQPYLLRISLAAPTQEIVARVGQAVLQQVRSSDCLPMLQFPQSAYEWDAASSNLSSLDWISWGNLRDNTPDTVRLRYLVDNQGASKVFNLPVASTTAMHKIKVLLVFADPSDLLRTRLGREDRAILEAIERAIHRDNIEITVRHAATTDSLFRALLEDQFQIVHLAGHGTAAGIVLETEVGKGQIVPQEVLAERFADYYKEHRTLRCVLLNACHTASLGRLIVRNGVPFSIAMEGEVGNAAAIEFSRGFYDALGAGKEIAFAYKEGCYRPRAKALNASFTPQLFP